MNNAGYLTAEISQIRPNFRKFLQIYWEVPSPSDNRIIWAPNRLFNTAGCDRQFDVIYSIEIWTCRRYAADFSLKRNSTPIQYAISNGNQMNARLILLIKPSIHFSLLSYSQYNYDLFYDLRGSRSLLKILRF